MTHEVIKALEAKAGKTITYLKEEFAKVRAGRANPNLLDGIVVECYGTQTPLNQIASVSVPEARMLFAIIATTKRLLSGPLPSSA